MSNRKYAMLLPAMLWATSAAADIPLIDDQPAPTDACGVTNVATTESADGRSLGVRQYGCVVNNRNVVFTVSVPALCASMSCGLIVDQHGASMSAAQQNAGTKLREYGWKAMQRGASTPYIVIQPNMTDLFDNETGGLDPVSVMGGAYSNELPVLNAFLANAIGAFHIDPRRIHMHGFSRGAQTTNAYYCSAAGKALFASYAMSGGSTNCALEQPVMVINGSTDPNIFAAASVADNLAKESGTMTTVLARDNNWQQPDLRFINWVWTPVGKQEHLRYRKGGVWLENIKHSGTAIPLAGHCLPVTTKAGWLVCTDTFEMGQKIIDFFIQHPRPAS